MTYLRHDMTQAFLPLKETKTAASKRSDMCGPMRTVEFLD